MAGRGALGLALALWASAYAAALGGSAPARTQAEAHAALSASDLFAPGDTCMVCHNDVTASDGQDVSIGAEWRASMMANSSRDPYWQAAVQRELMDFPAAAETIEDECSICHMPMTTFTARAAGGKGRILPHLPIGGAADAESAFAADGVACSVCHQIQPTNLGTPASFTGGYVIDANTPAGGRTVFGPFAVDAGRARVMQSSSSFVPAQATHIQQSELCGTCHTLFTHALAPNAAARPFPEQTPYLEWQQSAYRGSQTCQSCHMPVVPGEVPVTRVLGQPRPDVSRHSFRGGNFFMMRMLNRYRDDLGVRASPGEMDAAIARTEAHLRSDTVRLTITRAERTGSQLAIDVDVQNLAGHKFPTGYPSRRAWIQLTVRDANGRVVFESGALRPDGSVVGNDNDLDSARFEPHHLQIDSREQVQIYESVMVDPAGRVTTGLLSADRYAKDNRLLPRGLDKTRAAADIAVHGEARGDEDFADARDRVRYRISASGEPLTVTATLWFQPIGFRWAQNLKTYNAPAPQRFVRYFESMSRESALGIAQATATIR